MLTLMVEATGLDSRTAVLGHSRSQQSTGLLLCTAPTYLRHPALGAETKKQQPFSCCFYYGRAGGDESEPSVKKLFSFLNGILFVPSL